MFVINLKTIVVGLLLSERFFGFGDAFAVVCNFSPGRFHIVGNVYTCSVTKLENEWSPDIEVRGDHRRHKTNSDLNFISSDGIKFHAMPKGFQKVFLNLVGLHIKDGGIRHLTQDDLEDYTNLTYLSLNMNNIEHLDSVVFEFNSKLEHISFVSNKLTSIGGSTLKPLTKLHSAHFNLNICIDEYAVTRADVEKLVPIIRANCKVRFEPAILKLEQRYSILEESLRSKIAERSFLQPSTKMIEEKFDQQEKKLKILENKNDELNARISRLERFIDSNYPSFNLFD